jgi:hypothetical protein
MAPSSEPDPFSALLGSRRGRADARRLRPSRLGPSRWPSPLGKTRAVAWRRESLLRWWLARDGEDERLDGLARGFYEALRRWGEDVPDFSFIGDVRLLMRLGLCERQRGPGGVHYGLTEPAEWPTETRTALGLPA